MDATAKYTTYTVYLRRNSSNWTVVLDDISGGESYEIF